VPVVTLPSTRLEEMSRRVAMANVVSMPMPAPCGALPAVTRTRFNPTVAPFWTHRFPPTPVVTLPLRSVRSLSVTPVFGPAVKARAVDPACGWITVVFAPAPCSVIRVADEPTASGACALIEYWPSGMTITSSVVLPLSVAAAIADRSVHATAVQPLTAKSSSGVVTVKVSARAAAGNSARTTIARASLAVTAL
jgi:hypothetical protein